MGASKDYYDSHPGAKARKNAYMKQYMQTETHFFNFDTNNIDFSIIASPVADLLIYADELGDDFENDNFSQAVVGQVFNDTTELGTLIRLVGCG